MQKKKKEQKLQSKTNYKLCVLILLSFRNWDKKVVLILIIFYFDDM